MALADLFARTGRLRNGTYVDTLIYPIAAPSTGNSYYVNEISSMFPSTTLASGQPAYAVWNLNIVNTLDSVPYAWCAHFPIGDDDDPCLPGVSGTELNLWNIVGLYNATTNTTTDVLKAVTGLTALTSGPLSPGYLYIPHKFSPFTGPPPKGVIQNDTQWADVAWSQHVESYCLEYFGGITC